MTGVHLGRFIAAGLALAVAAPVLLLPDVSRAIDRTLPMRFELRSEGPAQACADHCRKFVLASGSVTADSPRDFMRFAKGRDLAGAIVVLDSDGGSVHGAMALGREIRKLGLDTTVGVLVDLQRDAAASRVTLSPRADCESMCAFVLLAGVHRFVPGEARVMVHQIWLGDRRDDPTAGSYSAEDLVLVQRDIGKLAAYTIEMGASIEILDLALRIPPWEPMHILTREEIRSARVATDEAGKPAATVAASPPVHAAPPASPIVDGVRPTAISERHWVLIDQSGAAALARSNTLTFEGEEIGDFDLMVACGADSERYEVRYVERRHTGDRLAVPSRLHAVMLTVPVGSVTLKIVSSKRRSDPDELLTVAAGSMPAALIDAFASAGNHSMLIETTSDRVVTGIRLGNTGARKSLPQLAAACALRPADRRADLSLPTASGALAAK